MLKTLLKKEWTLLVSYGSLVVLLIWGSGIMGSLGAAANVGLVFAWLFVVILLAAFGVVRHAECLAGIFADEPEVCDDFAAVSDGVDLVFALRIHICA